MAALILPRRFHEQPQHAVEVIDPRVFYAGLPATDFLNIADRAGAKTTTITAGKQTAWNGGIAYEDTATNFSIRLNGLGYPAGGAGGTRSWVAVFYLAGLGGNNNGRILEKRVSGGQTELLFVAPSGLDFYRAGTVPQESLTNGGLPTGAYYSAVVSAPAFGLGSSSIWLNGKKQALSTASGGSGSVTSTADDYVIGNRLNDNARGFDGQIFLIAGIDAALTDAEAEALSGNPWQLFRAPSRRIYFDIGAAGGFTDTVLSADGGAVSSLAAQAIAKAAASSSGVAASSLTAQALTQSTLSATGSASVSAVGQSLYQATVTIAGLATATFGGQSLIVSALASSGAAATAWSGQSIATGVVTAAGVTAVSWVSSGLTDAVFAFAGLGAASWAGRAIAKGAFSSAGTGTASWVSLVTGYADAAFQMAGAGATALAGRAIATAASAMQGAATAAFGGQTLKQGAFSSAGTSTGTWVGNIVAGATLAASGAGTAAYAGQSLTQASAFAAGQSVVNWMSTDIDPVISQRLRSLSVFIRMATPTAYVRLTDDRPVIRVGTDYPFTRT